MSDVNAVLLGMNAIMWSVCLIGLFKNVWENPDLCAWVWGIDHG